MENNRLIKLLIILIFIICISSGCDTGKDNIETEQNKDEITTKNLPTYSEETTDPAKEDALGVFEKYAAAWQDKNYEAMYRLLSHNAKDLIDEETYVNRYSNIFNGIKAERIQVLLLEHQERDFEHTINFQVNMDTLAGYLELTEYRMKVVYEPDDSDWRIEWTESLIFPYMQVNDQVRAHIISPKRGEVYDRHGRGLAINGELITIGIVPKSFIPVREEAVPLMAELLGISEDRINQIVDKATVSDWFYPLVTLSGDQNDLSVKLTSIDGVQYQRTSGRIYPGKESAGLLVGYIGPITAEEIGRHPDAGYSENDMIGKRGIELVYEKRLRGKNGGVIYLVDKETDNIIREIGRLDPITGEEIHLTIDLFIQEKAYMEMKEEKGSAAILDPRTGEILALISTPAFDPNVFQTYIPDEMRRIWNETDRGYFLNRFSAGYVPGSVFKFITAAIGLKYGSLDPDEVYDISGLYWQPNQTWGSYRVTRVSDNGPVNLRKAMITSDNIYFAMIALETKLEHFEQGAADFGLGESLPLSYPFYRSQLSNAELDREILIADTGYGQGEILTTTLHMALIYSTLATEGNLIKPALELDQNRQDAIWKKNTVRAADVPLLRDILLQVVEDPGGAGYDNTYVSRRILGKTGTAELKARLDDEDSKENGWFIAMDADEDSLIIAMMIEDVKDRGGSRYVVPFVKRTMEAVFSSSQ